MISKYEMQYIDSLRTIAYKGHPSLNERTGIVTRRLPATQVVVDLQKEFPILKSKKVNWIPAVREILWIMQQQSNNINDLKAHIWDAWADKDGSIGKAYGYQAAKSVSTNGKTFANQVKYVLDTLAANPSDRRCVIDLWCVDDLNDMNLVPCCYSTIWNIIDGKLNCMLVQRSADYPVGVPFDTTQYAALTIMFARHLQVEPGLLTHVMADSHIYENQMEGVRQQLDNYMLMSIGEVDKHIVGCNPQFHIRPGVDNFWDMTIEDFEVTDYQSMPAIKYPVAT